MIEKAVSHEAAFFLFEEGNVDAVSSPRFFGRIERGGPRSIEGL